MPRPSRCMPRAMRHNGARLQCSSRSLARCVIAKAQRGAEAAEPIADYYELLNVSPKSSETEIRQQYRKLQQKFHPDVAGEKYRAYSTQLNIAYAVLTDRDSKSTYDSIYKRSGRRGTAAAQVMEGLVGPLKERAVPLKGEELEVSYECAVDWIQQWGSTITFGCEMPFLTPLQIDPVPAGIRIAFIGSRNGAVQSLGDLYIEVDQDNMLHENVARVNVTRVSREPEYSLPGEGRVLDTLRNALKSKKRSQSDFQLSGFFATAAAGLLGFLPLVHLGTEETAYDGYRIPQRCDIPVAPLDPCDSSSES